MESWLNIRRFLIACALFVAALSYLFTLPMSTHFDDLVLERAYYADPLAKDDIRSVQSRQFTPFTGPLFLGNDHRPLWIRITLAPSAHAEWVITYQPNFIHRIETWLPKADGQWSMVAVGSALAFNQQAIGTLAPSLRVTPHAEQTTTIYARVTSPTTPFYVRVMSRDDSAHFDSLIQLVVGSFIGISLILSLLSFMIYTMTRDRLWLFDVLFNLSGLSILLIQIGLASKLIWPSSTDWVNQLCLIANCFYPFATSLLHRQIFRLYALAPWLYWPNTLALLSFPVLLGLIVAGYGDVAMRINNATIFLLSCYGVVVAIKAQHADRLMLLGFRVSYFGFITYFIWWGLDYVYQLQTGSLATLYPGFPASLFTMLMLLLILLRNTQLKSLEASHLAAEKRESDLQLAFAKQRHEETNNFLGMLLHEVKNPLSTIRMSVSNLRTDPDCQSPTVLRRLQNAHDSVDQVDNILQRTIDIDSFEHDGLLFEYESFELVEYLQQWCLAQPHAARIQLSAAAPLIVTTDTHLLGLMLRNLLDNALKYSPPESVVTVSVSQSSHAWQIAVRNRVGRIGFPDAERLFAKFYRLPLALRHSGMGLGLYWVRGMARRMAGDVVYQRDQDDVVFTLCLPI